MGAWLSRRRPASEELETLSAQVKQFRRDIETMSSQRKSALWYAGFLLFVATTTSVAYAVMQYERRLEQVGFSFAAFVVGGFVLFLFRRLIGMFYDFRVRRKQHHLDDLIAKKKTILENVKETETFKVAKEILAKYDEEYVDPAKKLSPPAGQPQGPMSGELRRRSGPPTPIHQRAIPPGVAATMMPRPPPPPPGAATPSPPGGQGPPFPQFVRPRTLMPIRPFHEEAKTNVEKVVDFFFGDGPGSRLALICAQCHVHNGMALPGEYDYLAYHCYTCGHFNPAHKMRPTASAMTTPAISRQPSTRSLVAAVKEESEDTQSEKKESEEETDYERVSGEETPGEETPESTTPQLDKDKETN